ncbi:MULTISPECIES: PhaM family polyhydroxyalkanoate granule multifunctional regulatory protein [Burkholderia]|uniref:PhaM family polyhydroxyalkanoate granule multifunctional regulatory protein n=2 Tax=Burkholderia TaxID=32008 RepID=A0ABW7LBH0_9BURK|nr:MULTISPECIES: PhaM family polyhydroxyalkanoate granule multifunctional regulatory protein [Burkholderia]MEB2505384.1 alginate biosynthesis protein AlgP [Burkholderia anthinoferrum]MEB2531605.1 alginate biosynthesis protein AlgP [Burkholderia anthinoferrum]MEB2565133.1 alginate biosynthesis protein AlgP [Burkholderia anthinoferrum]MEB2580030.1 alginate biosynthesis protein AlgP [Burkholderia anthinoferrum]KVE04135.1 alginate biosynthesis protein AlgP [Burkholderia anthina]
MTTDASGANPFAGFAGFQPADMMDRMWDMIRMSPFGGMAPFPGAAHGLPPSLSSMSDMMSPLTSVEELDKRITDLRAVEQWLKLNLGMLQSAIQALEVQRATLATLRAFGAFAQSSMSAAEDAAVAAAQAAKTSAGEAAPAPDAAAPAADAPEGDPAQQPFDPAGWWNLLQTQFNQLASLAMAQPGMQPAAPGAASPEPAAAPEPVAKPAAAAPRKPAAKRAAKPSGSAAARAAAASSPETRPPKRST